MKPHTLSVQVLILLPLFFIVGIIALGIAYAFQLMQSEKVWIPIPICDQCRKSCFVKFSRSRPFFSGRGGGSNLLCDS